MSDFDAARILDREAESLLTRAGCDPHRPTDLVALAKLLGIAVDFDGRGPAEGSLRLRDGRAVIEISRWGSASRRRFTLAHELGHAYVLHPQRGLSSGLLARWPSEEAFCNAFAASVLLPITPLTTATRGTQQTVGTLLWLARRFAVSAAAVSIRLLGAGLWNHGLLRWHWFRGAWCLRFAAGMRKSLHTIELEATSAWQLRQLRTGWDETELTLRFHVNDVLREIDARVCVLDKSAWAVAPLLRYERHWRPHWASSPERLPLAPGVSVPAVPSIADTDPWRRQYVADGSKVSGLMYGARDQPARHPSAGVNVSRARGMYTQLQLGAEDRCVPAPGRACGCARCRESSSS